MQIDATRTANRRFDQLNDKYNSLDHSKQDLSIELSRSQLAHSQQVASFDQQLKDARDNLKKKDEQLKECSKKLEKKRDELEKIAALREEEKQDWTEKHASERAKERQESAALAQSLKKTVRKLSKDLEKTREVEKQLGEKDVMVKRLEKNRFDLEKKLAGYEEAAMGAKARLEKSQKEWERERKELVDGHVRTVQEWEGKHGELDDAWRSRHSEAILEGERERDGERESMREEFRRCLVLQAESEVVKLAHVELAFCRRSLLGAGNGIVPSIVGDGHGGGPAGGAPVGAAEAGAARVETEKGAGGTSTHTGEEPAGYGTIITPTAASHGATSTTPTAHHTATHGGTASKQHIIVKHGQRYIDHTHDHVEDSWHGRADPHRTTSERGHKGAAALHDAQHEHARSRFELIIRLLGRLQVASDQARSCCSGTVITSGEMAEAYGQSPKQATGSAGAPAVPAVLVTTGSGGASAVAPATSDSVKTCIRELDSAIAELQSELGNLRAQFLGAMRDYHHAVLRQGIDEEVAGRVEGVSEELRHKHDAALRELDENHSEQHAKMREEHGKEVEG